jgi:glycosyltransferase involved in cell wall biosynthesis
MSNSRPLRILHVLRAPVGGLFRHVADLARAQVERGHSIGIIADATTGSTETETTLQQLATIAKLGLLRVPMSRNLGPRDFNAARLVAAHSLQTKADVLHGHGAKGGAYVRLAVSTALRVYTPHGGSLHYDPRSPIGFLYIGFERLLARRTDLFLFESEFGLAAYSAKVGNPTAITRVVHNGVTPEELKPVTPDADAEDIVFVGELRKLKGVDLLIDATARLIGQKLINGAVLFGDGPDAAQFRADVKRRGLSEQIKFGGSIAAREAFKRGRVLVVPSRAESLPYIVLEAAAASVTLVATRVGGISEIFGPDAPALVLPEAPQALGEAILEAIKTPPITRTERLHRRVAQFFTVGAMTDGVLAAYAEAMAARA